MAFFRGFVHTSLHASNTSFTIEMGDTSLKYMETYCGDGNLLVISDSNSDSKFYNWSFVSSCKLSPVRHGAKFHGDFFDGGMSSRPIFSRGRIFP